MGLIIIIVSRCQFSSLSLSLCLFHSLFLCHSLRLPRFVLLCPQTLLWHFVCLLFSLFYLPNCPAKAAAAAVPRCLPARLLWPLPPLPPLPLLVLVYTQHAHPAHPAHTPTRSCVTQREAAAGSAIKRRKCKAVLKPKSRSQ